MKIKIFCSIFYDDLEEQVNEWLSENELSIELDNIQFIKEDGIFAIMILYEEPEEEQDVLVPKFIMDYVEKNKKGE